MNDISSENDPYIMTSFLKLNCCCLSNYTWHKIGTISSNEKNLQNTPPHPPQTKELCVECFCYLDYNNSLGTPKTLSLVFEEEQLRLWRSQGNFKNGHSLINMAEILPIRLLCETQINQSNNQSIFPPHLFW